jgi:hypothetical protein
VSFEVARRQLSVWSVLLGSDQFTDQGDDPTDYARMTRRGWAAVSPAAAHPRECRSPKGCSRSDHPGQHQPGVVHGGRYNAGTATGDAQQLRTLIEKRTTSLAGNEVIKASDPYRRRLMSLIRHGAMR